jgi:isocitrate lyase
MDDKGKNILYTSSGEERYPNFKLYKMIARMVHAHTPENQMAFGLFSQYDVSKTNDKKKKKIIKPTDRIGKINIDVIPKLFV